MPDGFPQPPVLVPPRTSGPPPSLPEGWHAAALLTPYRNEQLYAADIRYDWSVQALRVLSYGVDEGAIELLFVANEFYILIPAGDPNHKVLGPFPSATPVPAPDWLAGRNMALQGQGDLLGVPCDWWLGYSPNANGYEGSKPPVPTPVCNWVWTHSASGLPFRFFFNSADNPYAFPVLGDFAIVNFTAFEPVATPHLAPEVAQARAKAEPPSDSDLAAVAAARTLDGLRAAAAGIQPDPSLLQGSGRAGDLVKGLEPAPVGAPVPSWSPRLCFTGYTYLTAKPTMSAAALPLRVFYDQPQGRMLTRAALSDTQFDGVPVEDMILDTSTTHSVTRYPDGSHKCDGTDPVGLPKLDWGRQDGGIPKAVIRDNPVLGPGEVIHVTSLPSDHGRWFWTWYTDKNDGRLFMETPQLGDVWLVLTDYYAFDHDPPAFPDEAFVIPPDCLSAAPPG